MEYYLIRKKFVELSGRYDLVNANWTDNGADFFLNEGQMFLDRSSDIMKASAKNIQPIVAGTIVVKTIGLRTVREVWAGNSTDGLVPLVKRSLLSLREEYGEQLSSVTQGTPAYFAPCAFRPYPDAIASGITGWSGYYDIDDLVLDSAHYTYRGIIITPPPDKTYYISIVGLFYSPTLSATLSESIWTQTKSYWTENHPGILIQAGLLKLEAFYRNTEGVKDWKFSLDLDLTGLDKDEAADVAVDTDQMEG
jgi:hypothetical protein